MGSAVRLRRGAGPDEVVVWYEGLTLTSRRYLVTDERGSVIAGTDGAGATLFKNVYDEYGRPGSANQGRFQYTGQMWLAEAGLYHYKARVYDPGLGRFLQTDPIGYADGLNLYAYVGGDPVNATDPTGLEVADEIFVHGIRRDYNLFLENLRAIAIDGFFRDVGSLSGLGSQNEGAEGGGNEEKDCINTGPFVGTSEAVLGALLAQLLPTILQNFQIDGGIKFGAIADFSTKGVARLGGTGNLAAFEFRFNSKSGFDLIATQGIFVGASVGGSDKILGIPTVIVDQARTGPVGKNLAPGTRLADQPFARSQQLNGIGIGIALGAGFDLSAGVPRGTEFPPACTE